MECFISVRTITVYVSQVDVTSVSARMLVLVTMRISGVLGVYFMTSLIRPPHYSDQVK